MVIDGREGRPYDGVGELVVTPFRHAYAALREPHWMAVVDGAEEGGYERVDGLRMSAQGNVAYVARRRDDHWVVHDGTASAHYAHVEPSSLRFAPDGQLSFVARTHQGQTHMVINGALGPAFDAVTPAVFAARGQRWGYIATRGRHAIVVVDGKASIPYGWARELVFSPDGERHAYFARRGPFEMVAASNRRHALERVVVGTLVFDESGQHWACVAGIRRLRRFFLVIDGAATKRFDIGEVVAASARIAPHKRAAHALDVGLVRRWVAAELALELRRRRSPERSN